MFPREPYERRIRCIREIGPRELVLETLQAIRLRRTLADYPSFPLARGRGMLPIGRQGRH